MASEEGGHNWDYSKMDEEKFIKTLGVLNDWIFEAQKEADKRGLIINGLGWEKELTILKKLT